VVVALTVGYANGLYNVLLKLVGDEYLPTFSSISIDGIGSFHRSVLNTYPVESLPNYTFHHMEESCKKLLQHDQVEVSFVRLSRQCFGRMTVGCIRSISHIGRISKRDATSVFSVVK
jgi:hypothetical protein